MIKSHSLLEGGALMPIGDYKRFNIALGIEMLTTTFSDENDVNPFIALVIKANTSFRKSLERLPTVCDPCLVLGVTQTSYLTLVTSENISISVMQES
jgi:hypothetical protein